MQQIELWLCENDIYMIRSNIFEGQVLLGLFEGLSLVQHLIYVVIITNITYFEISLHMFCPFHA